MEITRNIMSLLFGIKVEVTKDNSFSSCVIVAWLAESFVPSITRSAPSTTSCKWRSYVFLVSESQTFCLVSRIYFALAPPHHISHPGRPSIRTTASLVVANQIRNDRQARLSGELAHPIEAPGNP